MKFKKDDLKNVSNTKRWITFALFDLMSTNNYTKITITQLIAEADIARRTFYNNYKTKDDVIREYIRNAFNTVWENIDNPEILTPYDVGFTFFNACFERVSLIRLLKENNLLRFLYEELLSGINELIKIANIGAFNLKGFSERELIYFNTFQSAGLVEMAERWIINDCKESIEEMAILYSKFTLLMNSQ